MLVNFILKYKKILKIRNIFYTIVTNLMFVPIDLL